MRALAIFIVLAFWTIQAEADTWQRLPKSYELAGVRLNWSAIPTKDYDNCYGTGWQLKNPEDLTCERWSDGSFFYQPEDWFSCRLRINPLLKTMTILNASKTQSPW